MEIWTTSLDLVSFWSLIESRTRRPCQRPSKPRAVMISPPLNRTKQRGSYGQYCSAKNSTKMPKSRLFWRKLYFGITRIFGCALLEKRVEFVMEFYLRVMDPGKERKFRSCQLPSIIDGMAYFSRDFLKISPDFTFFNLDFSKWTKKSIEIIFQHFDPWTNTWLTQYISLTFGTISHGCDFCPFLSAKI